MDSRSDKVAKDVYVKHLMKCGYTNVQIVSSPVDIKDRYKAKGYD